jgi:hypothetical protein
LKILNPGLVESRIHMVCLVSRFLEEGIHHRTFHQVYFTKSFLMIIEIGTSDVVMDKARSTQKGSSARIAQNV